MLGGDLLGGRPNHIDMDDTQTENGSKVDLRREPNCDCEEPVGEARVFIYEFEASTV